MSAPRSTRSQAARIVQWGVMLLALWNLGRAVALWRQTSWLSDLPLTPNSHMRLAAAAGWAVLFLLLAVGLWRRTWWSRLFVPLLLAAYGVYELGMTIVFASSPPALLPAFAYALFVGFAGWALWRSGVDPLFHSR